MITCFLLHDVSSRYANSLELDFHLVSLHVYMEELSASFNAQDQAPDSYLHLFLQLVSQDSVQELFRHTIVPYFGVLRIEFQLCCLWIRFVSQGVVCFHSVGFGGHSLIHQYTPRFSVDNLRKNSQVLARLHTKQVISYFFK